MPEPTVRDLLQDMAQKFDSDKTGGMNAVIQYKLTGEQGGNWFMTVHDKTCTLEEGLAPKANFTVSLAAQDFIDIVTRKRDGLRTFMQGKIRISGDMGVAMKLQSLFLPK